MGPAINEPLGRQNAGVNQGQTSVRFLKPVTTWDATTICLLPGGSDEATMKGRERGGRRLKAGREPIWWRQLLGIQPLGPDDSRSDKRPDFF